MVRLPTTIETRGVIIKEERVRSLTEKIIPGTLVLENYEPYPGYYGKNIPADVIPRSIFLVLLREYTPIDVARKCQKVLTSKYPSCNASYGQISVNQSNYYCIRLKKLNSFDDIPGIQEKLIELGINFHRTVPIDQMAIITVDKSFLLERLDNHVLMDLTGNHTYYFDIPYALPWNKFKELTRKVKHNIDNHFFDASTGYLWQLEGPREIVRIFDLKANLTRIKEIRELYLKELERGS